MGFLDGLFGRKLDPNFDWLELDGPRILRPKWETICSDEDDLEYSIDRSTCFKDDEIVWWKQRIGVPDDRYEYSICGASIVARGVMIPICRTLSDPENEQIKPDMLKLMARADDSTPLGECLDAADRYAQFNGHKSIPPYVFYAMSIVKGNR